jgi:hypothetical protein
MTCSSVIIGALVWNTGDLFPVAAAVLDTVGVLLVETGIATWDISVVGRSLDVVGNDVEDDVPVPAVVVDGFSRALARACWSPCSTEVI